MSQLISFVLADSSCEAREENENYKNEKSLPTVRHEPTNSCLLDGRSNQQRHRSVFIVDIYR